MYLSSAEMSQLSTDDDSFDCVDENEDTKEGYEFSMSE